jgi:hypothetical protein
MENFTTAWVVIVVAGLIGAFGLSRLLKNLRWQLFRWLASLMALTFFVTPAPIPNFDDAVAPAFLVLVFEAFFQTNGEPAVSLRILGLALFTVLILTTAGYFVARQKARKTADEDANRQIEQPLLDS